ncbi:acyltransferase [Bradyrhizobium diazoefficiens]|uniref:acyltransferase family protein n=1 Tax=Bradyrhizobium diazoefficiens TaxID=1355477 RepID=UPI00190B1EB2|nr:acyltransferase [Bradyrhizobium diazoefficiens]QQO11668.1 acyltransferase [Bradyrhizobium diazoefficiens]
MTSNKYCPQLDGIRTFCIIFTVLNHIPAAGRPWFVDGTVGVDAFFPLSGWLITWLLLEERRKGRIDLRAFYLRRIFRIVPLYYLTIGIYTGAAVAVYFLTANSAKLDELRTAALYLVTFNSEYRPDNAGVIFGHAWTLGIEEKFYVIWPLMLFLAARFTGVAVVGAFIVIGALFGLFGTNDYLIRGYFGLSVGAGMAIWLNSSPYATVFRNIPIGWISLGMTVVMYGGLIMAPSVYWHLGLSASVSLLIVSVWFDREQGLARFLALPPLVWLGTLTYAIYLLQTLASNLVQGVLQKLHVDATFLTIFLADYAVSVALAWLAHVAIEQPAISIGRRLATRRKVEQSALIPARPEV